MAKNFVINTVFRAVDKTSKVLGKMRTRISRFAARTKRAFGRLNKATQSATGFLSRGLAIGAAAATGAVVGLFSALNKTADSMDVLAKTARSVNFPIEEFQEWRFVAEQSGVKTETFNKSVQKFTRSMGELKGGYGSLYTALKKSNPALLKQLKSTDNVADAFDIYLKSIGQAPSAMEKAALSAAGFGRAGIDMINMANLGADEIAKLRAEMRENGVVTEEQANQAEAYNDMMNRVKLTLTGLMVNVLTPLMPILTDIANRVREWAVENRGLVSAKFKEYVKWIIDNFPEIVYWIEKIGGTVAVFYAIATAIKAVNAALMMNPIVLIVGAIIAAIAAIIIFRKEIKEFLYKVHDWVMEKFNAALDFIVEFWTWVKDTFSAGVDSILEFFSSAMDGIMAYFQPVIDAFAAGWEYVGEVFHNVWQGIKDFGASIIDWIMSKVDLVVGGFKAMGDFLGFGDDEGGGAATAGAGAGAGPSPVRPSIDISKTSTERMERSEVTIKDETGRAKKTKGNGKGFKLVHSGAMP